MIGNLLLFVGLPFLAVFIVGLAIVIGRISKRIDDGVGRGDPSRYVSRLTPAHLERMTEREIEEEQERAVYRMLAAGVSPLTARRMAYASTAERLGLDPDFYLDGLELQELSLRQRLTPEQEAMLEDWQRKVNGPEQKYRFGDHQKGQPVRSGVQRSWEEHNDL